MGSCFSTILFFTDVALRLFFRDIIHREHSKAGQLSIVTLAAFSSPPYRLLPSSSHNRNMTASPYYFIPQHSPTQTFSIPSPKKPPILLTFLTSSSTQSDPYTTHQISHTLSLHISPLPPGNLLSLLNFLVS
jgi:hypothetical protein